MKTTIYYVASGDSFEDAKSILQHRLETYGNEDNFFTIIAGISKKGHELTVIDQLGYNSNDLLLRNIVNRINESQDEYITEDEVWTAEVNANQGDKHYSLTNEVTSLDTDLFLFIINMHT